MFEKCVEGFFLFSEGRWFEEEDVLKGGFYFFFCALVDLFESFGGESSFGVYEDYFVSFSCLGCCYDDAEV